MNETYNMFGTKPLTKPVQAYDPTKTVEQNMAGQGTPSAQNIINAYKTPQAKEQVQPVVEQKVDVNPEVPQSGIDSLSSMFTTPEEERKHYKSSVQKQRIMALTDVLRHIGNIYNASKGAPVQKFNSPVAEERQRYLQEKNMRDATSARYMSYRNQVEAQKQRMAELRHRMFNDERNYRLKEKESDARAILNEARAQRQQTLMDLDAARLKGQISENEYKGLRNRLYPEEVHSRIARNYRTGGGRSGGGGRSRGDGMSDYTVSKTYSYDNLGKKTGETTTRTVNRPNGQTHTTQSENRFGGTRTGGAKPSAPRKATNNKKYTFKSVK